MAIICFKHRFIFIKTFKTAGTSIEIDLSPVVGDDAVVTPIYPPVSGHRPRNYLGPAGNELFHNHMSAARVRKQLGLEVFDSMLSFCVEREPVEKCISHFHMLRNSEFHNADGGYDKSWSEYVAAGRFPINLETYTEVQNGRRQLIVNRILRYDELDRELPKVLNEVGIPEFELRSQAKSEYSRKRLVAPSDVTESERDCIYEAFRETLDVTDIDWS